jgi:hypothetical protein
MMTPRQFLPHLYVFFWDAVRALQRLTAIQGEISLQLRLGRTSTIVDSGKR